MSYIQWQEDQDYQRDAAYDYHSELWASEIESMKREGENMQHALSEEEAQARMDYCDNREWRSLVDALEFSFGTRWFSKNDPDLTDTEDLIGSDIKAEWKEYNAR